ncbi:hypothetical protein E2C01_080431 [Portunus trituberculatus]|uniref:Uncharacterized protein n=1 Tax=Portunus trituberculatus TaxID=210409 RepID=A0A5B7IU39_PORTR|nr:hypothetical protein [Portunus trituberculatus]
MGQAVDHVRVFVFLLMLLRGTLAVIRLTLDAVMVPLFHDFLER